MTLETGPKILAHARITRWEGHPHPELLVATPLFLILNYAPLMRFTCLLLPPLRRSARLLRLRCFHFGRKDGSIHCDKTVAGRAGDHEGFTMNCLRIMFVPS
jgi:hypothetical protein